MFLEVALASKDEAVVLVVDPAWDDVAGYQQKVPLLQEYKVVKVFSHLGKDHSYVPGKAKLYREFAYQSRAPNPKEAAKEVCPQLKAMSIPIAAVIPTSDGAVALTDQLAACTGVRGNPAEGPLAETRRNKWFMGEAVRKSGLRSVKQVKVSGWESAKEFLESWEPPLSTERPCVFKILEGSGGAGTSRVNSLAEAKKYFDSITGTKDKYGDVNTVVLIQEYLTGKEYAVDSVTRDGVHKVIAVWLEDFRPANGIFDQYFGFKLMDPEDALTKTIIDYSNKVLDAVGLQNGAANTEVKYLENEQQPCLVEVNARWAGVNWNDGLAVEKACVGEDQITATFATYLDQQAFAKMPDVRPITQYGAVVFTINYQPGVLTGLPGLAVAKQSSSYLSSDIDSASGLSGIMDKFLPKTTPDTIPINIALASKNKKVLDKDYSHLIQIQTDRDFFKISPAAGITSLDSHAINRDRSLGGSLLIAIGMTIVGVATVALLVHAGVSKRKIEEEVYLAIE